MSVHLGFVTPVEDELRADIDDFPSKVGGKPVRIEDRATRRQLETNSLDATFLKQLWLNPNPLSAEEVTCGVCEKPQILLLQVGRALEPRLLLELSCLPSDSLG